MTGHYIRECVIVLGVLLEGTFEHIFNYLI
jgi:hypothetical protein